MDPTTFGYRSQDLGETKRLLESLSKLPGMEQELHLHQIGSERKLWQLFEACLKESRDISRKHDQFNPKDKLSESEDKMHGLSSRVIRRIDDYLNSPASAGIDMDKRIQTIVMLLEVPHPLSSTLTAEQVHQLLPSLEISHIVEMLVKVRVETPIAQHILAYIQEHAKEFSEKVRKYSTTLPLSTLNKCIFELTRHEYNHPGRKVLQDEFYKTAKELFLASGGTVEVAPNVISQCTNKELLENDVEITPYLLFSLDEKQRVEILDRPGVTDEKLLSYLEENLKGGMSYGGVLDAVSQAIKQRIEREQFTQLEQLRKLCRQATYSTFHWNPGFKALAESLKIGRE